MVYIFFNNRYAYIWCIHSCLDCLGSSAGSIYIHILIQQKNVIPPQKLNATQKQWLVRGWNNIWDQRLRVFHVGKMGLMMIDDNNHTSQVDWVGCTSISHEIWMFPLHTPSYTMFFCKLLDIASISCEEIHRNPLLKGINGICCSVWGLRSGILRFGAKICADVKVGHVDNGCVWLHVELRISRLQFRMGCLPMKYHEIFDL